MLQRYGFRIIDSEQLSLEEKIRVFSKVRYLVTLSGAGMANILFRRGAPLNVLELHSRFSPPENGDFWRPYGYSWDHLAGLPQNVKDERDHDHYSVSPALLEEKMAAWFR